MEPTSKTNTVRSLLLFVIIGILLLAVVILGVRWAKGRSEQIASSNQPVTEQPAEQAQEQKQPEAQPTPVVPQQQPTVNTNQPAVHTVASGTPSHVPATGMEDAILPIAMLAATVFTASNYLQSRRRLVQYK